MPILTEAELRDRIRRPRRGMKVAVEPGTRFSPAARDFIAQWRLEIVEKTEGADPPGPPPTRTAPASFLVRPANLPAPKPEHMTQLDAEHLAPKNIPRIRFRGKMDSVHGLTQLTAARARSFQLPELARHLDALAAYCREIVSAEYNHREVMAIQVAGLDAAALRHATHHPKETLGIPHLTPTPEDHEMLHWLNFLRTQVRETELAALDAFAPPPDYVPTRLDLIQAMNRLSSAVYYLELLFKAGKLSWQAQP